MDYYYVAIITKRRCPNCEEAEKFGLFKKEENISRVLGPFDNLDIAQKEVESIGWLIGDRPIVFKSNAKGIRETNVNLKDDKLVFVGWDDISKQVSSAVISQLGSVGRNRNQEFAALRKAVYNLIEHVRDGKPLRSEQLKPLEDLNTEIRMTKNALREEIAKQPKDLTIEYINEDRIRKVKQKLVSGTIKVEKLEKLPKKTSIPTGGITDV